MYDPGNVYLIGFALLLLLAAATMFFAKRDLNKRSEPTKLTNTPIIACVSMAALLVMAGVVKVTVFADYYNEHSIYMPTA